MSSSKVRHTEKGIFKQERLLIKSASEGKGVTPSQSQTFHVTGVVHKFVPKEAWSDNSVNRVICERYSEELYRSKSCLVQDNIIATDKEKSQFQCVASANAGSYKTNETFKTYNTEDFRKQCSLSHKSHLIDESTKDNLSCKSFKNATRSHARVNTEADEPDKYINAYTCRCSSQAFQKCLSLKHNPLVRKKVNKLVHSKSLDCDLDTKHRGYQPYNGISVIPFNNMFTKTNHEILRTDIATLRNQKKSDNNEYKSANDRCSSAQCVSKKLPNLGNSGPFFSEKELQVIDKTRNDLRQQICLAKSEKEDESRKIQLNIFLKPQVENSSFETPDLLEDFDEQNKETENMVSEVIDVETLPGSIKLAECTQSHPEFTDNFEALVSDPHQEIQTMMSMRCSSPNLVKEFCSLNQEKVPKREEASEQKTERKRADTLPDISKMEFLRTLIKESKYYITSTQQSTPKDAKQTTFHIETEFSSPKSPANQSKPPDNIYPSVSPRIVSKSHRKVKVTYSKTSKNNSGLELNSADSKNGFQMLKEVVVPADFHDDLATQAFRKKLEESKELHRRLHFCGMKVSKETVIRALMSPAQIKMYEKLHQSS